MEFEHLQHLSRPLLVDDFVESFLLLVGVQLAIVLFLSVQNKLSKVMQSLSFRRLRQFMAFILRFGWSKSPGLTPSMAVTEFQRVLIAI